MSTSTVPPQVEPAGIVAEWFDRLFPADRRRALRLERGEDGATRLYDVLRASAGDQWGAPRLVAFGITVEDAGRVAAGLGLRYPSGAAGSTELYSDPPDSGGWTVVSDEGLAMFREDLLSEDEAREHVRRHPSNPAGKRQYAVPAEVARELGRSFRLIGERGDTATRIERRLATLAILDEAGVAPAEAAKLSAELRRESRAVGGAGWSVRA